MRKYLVALVCLLGFVLPARAGVFSEFVQVPVHAASTVEVPGVSAALFAAPYYTCSTNYYVSTTGSDTTGNGTSGNPWATIAHAEPHGAAGVCINIANGTYSAGASITHGGNLASSTGYVVYRCQNLNACTITDPGNNTAAALYANANYIWFDGLTLTASTQQYYGQGIGVQCNCSTFTFSQHHIWVTNSIISGYGQSGIQPNNGDYMLLLHNVVFDNSHVTCCPSCGSGISIYEPIAVTGYTRTADDSNNKVTGNIGTAFHNVINWNVLYNNAITDMAGCGFSPTNPYNTDGNNIILDTFNWNNAGGTSNYTPGSLVAFNVVYNAGGGGVHIFNSENITAANNSCYNHYLDPYNNGSSRACMDNSASYGITMINNIAEAIPAASSGCGFGTGATPYQQWASAFLADQATGATNTWSNNISKQIGANTPGCSANGTVPTGDVHLPTSATYSTAANKVNTDPLWVAVGNISVGTETTPPNGTNFALQGGSPAIGYGVTKSYLSAQSVDAGACYHTLSSCP